MNKDQYWHTVIRERPELQAGPATITLTVFDVRKMDGAIERWRNLARRITLYGSTTPKRYQRD